MKHKTLFSLSFEKYHRDVLFKGDHIVWKEATNQLAIHSDSISQVTKIVYP